MGSLVYLLSTRVDLGFSVHRLAKFSANPGKVHFEGLINLLRYINYNKALGLKYYADLKNSPVTDQLRQANIKRKNHLIDFSDSSCQYCYTLKEVQEHTLYFIKMGQCTMAHIFQEQLLNQL